MTTRSPAGDAANEDDRRWFAAHPGAGSRVRLYIPGEFDEVQFLIPPELVLVVQVCPGYRHRYPFPRLSPDAETSLV